MVDHTEEEAGGFLPATGLPSPAPSSVTNRRPNLPHPRNRSIPPGSGKEDVVRRFVEERLLHVSRRYVKKFGGSETRNDLPGYQHFSEVCRDLDVIINVLWRSGTRKCDYR